MRICHHLCAAEKQQYGWDPEVRKNELLESRMIGTQLNHTGCKPLIAIKLVTKFARHIFSKSLALSPCPSLLCTRAVLWSRGMLSCVGWPTVSVSHVPGGNWGVLERLGGCGAKGRRRRGLHIRVSCCVRDCYRLRE